MLKIIIGLSTLLVCGVSLAQSEPQLEQRVRELERQVYRLQNMTSNLDYRLRNIENGSVQPGPVSATYSAILVDTGYNKTFLGKGSTKLQAEADVRQLCGKSVNSMYCNGEVRFGQQAYGSHTAYCIVVDSGYGKTFTGEGADVIEAEAKAKQSCQSTVNAMYCGKATPRCETN